MRLKPLLIFPALLLSLSVCFAQTTEGDVWDTALDRYERICNECIDLKARIAAGETVTRDEAAGVFMELSQLRRQLSGDNGQMSVAQHERFGHIGRCFEQGRKVSDGDSAGNTDSVEKEAEMMPDEDMVYDVEEYLNRLTRDTGEAPAASAPKKNRMTVMALAGFNPFSFGVMLAGRPGKFGGYVGFLSNLHPLSYSYSCTSDGIACFSDGTEGYFWAAPDSGTRRGNLSVTAGLVYAPWDFIDFRLGAGFGMDRYLWTDSEGLRVLVRDLSRSGVVVDAGVDYTWKMLSVGIGVSTLKFRSVTPYLGLGVSF